MVASTTKHKTEQSARNRNTLFQFQRSRITPTASGVLHRPQYHHRGKFRPLRFVIWNPAQSADHRRKDANPEPSDIFLN